MDQGSYSYSSTNEEPHAIHKVIKKPDKEIRLTSWIKYDNLKGKKVLWEKGKEVQLKERGL